MATIYANAAGALLRIIRTDGEAMLYVGGPVPAGTAFTIAYDPVTNAVLDAQLDTELARFNAPAGVLRRAGVPVVIAADSEDEQFRKQALAAYQALAPFANVAAGTIFTNAQRDAAIRLLAQVDRGILRLFKERLGL